MRFPVATVRSLAHRSRFAAAAAAVASFGTVVGGGITMLESARTPLPLARVVSYNVLSSHLCGADHYIKCKPEDLDPPTRRKRVEALLSEHMDKQAVICLQEVSVQWVGELTPFFERAGQAADAVSQAQHRQKARGRPGFLLPSGRSGQVRCGTGPRIGRGGVQL